MAIVYENQYHKITKSIVNFVNQTTEIEMDVYKDQQNRELEKEISQRAEEVKQNISNYLVSIMDNLISETNKIQNIETIADRDKFLQDNPEIQKLLDEQEQQQEEGLMLIDSMLKVNIDLEKLKYKTLWKQFGLDADLCKKIEYLGTASIGIDKILDSDLTNLYTEVKTKIVGNIEDC